jgi:DNA-binding CsgD family transcriptional regulator/PAS domain-containing protein
MQDAERLSELIGDIYDTALDESLWPDVLEKIAQFAGGPNAALWSKDASSETGDFAHFRGFDPGYVQAYFDEYMKLDPASALYFHADIGEPIAQADAIPHGEFLETRFYKEWARPQGLIDCVNVALDKSGAGLAMFGVSRHRRDGVADDEMFRRMRFIAPHIRRVALVGRAMERNAVEAATFAEALDGLRAGVFLVDAGGRIVHSNIAGQIILAEGDILRVVGDRLAFADPRANASLREIFLAAGQGDAAIGGKGVALPLTARTGGRHVAHVLPLTSSARQRIGDSLAAAAAIFVRKVEIVGAAPPEAIAKAYRLTPAELRVLLAVVEVGGVPDVADALGVAGSTVKSHLGQIYEKTGVSRQADLVKLVAGFASPLLS